MTFSTRALLLGTVAIAVCAASAQWLAVQFITPGYVYYPIKTGDGVFHGSEYPHLGQWAFGDENERLKIAVFCLHEDMRRVEYREKMLGGHDVFVDGKLVRPVDDVLVLVLLPGGGFRKHVVEWHSIEPAMIGTLTPDLPPSRFLGSFLTKEELLWYSKTLSGNPETEQLIY